MIAFPYFNRDQLILDESLNQECLESEMHDRLLDKQNKTLKINGHYNIIEVWFSKYT